MDQLRVVVADDHRGVLSALVGVLDEEVGFTVVRAVETGYAAVAAATEELPDLVLLDVNMRGSGPEAVRLLRELRPRPVVVAISAQSTATTIEEMVRAGATGFVTKGHAGADLIDVLTRCAHGEVVLASPAGAAALGALLEGRHKVLAEISGE